MNPRVKTVKPKKDYTLEIVFDNGEVGMYDCTPLLGFGIFKELEDMNYFRLVKAAERTVTWPHGQDICPDTLYADSKKMKPKRKIDQPARR